jgi:hypothetical protein
MTISKILQKSQVIRLFSILLLINVVTSGFGLFGPLVVPNAEALTGYSHTLTLTIDHTKVTSALTDFPLLVHLTSGSPVLSELTQVNRKRMAITQGAEQLFVEIESWTSNEAILWVKVPSISSTVNTLLSLSYDKTHAENTAYVGDTSDPTTPKVWSNGFVGVWHLASNTFLDSSGNRNNGIGGAGLSGSVSASRIPTITSGEIGSSASFDGVNDLVKILDKPGYSVINNAGHQLSVSLWISPRTLNQHGGSWWSPIGKGDYSVAIPNTRHEWKFNFYDDSCGAYPTGRSQRRSFYMLDKDSGQGSGDYAQPGYNYAGTIPKWTANSWTYVVGQVNGNYVYMYNGPGVLGHAGVNWSTGEGASGNTIQLRDTGAALWLGCYGDNRSTSGNFNGRLDEVRISSVARSVSWMKADYYSQMGQLVKIG